MLLRSGTGGEEVHARVATRGLRHVPARPKAPTNTTGGEKCAFRAVAPAGPASRGLARARRPSPVAAA